MYYIVCFTLKFYNAKKKKKTCKKVKKYTFMYQIFFFF